MASAIAMLKISLGAASGQFPPRKKFCGIDIFLRVDRRRAARFPYNGNFTVYGAFPAVFSRQRKGYQPCSPQCTGRGYWCGTGNHSAVLLKIAIGMRNEELGIGGGAEVCIKNVG
ncbi:MAG: hypothetical protein PUF35_07455 [Subdoligranulum sp.]|nr:hypothetical protein [Subdoligranulum sp.]